MKYYINRTNPALSGIDSIFNDLFGDSYYSAKIPAVDVSETSTSYEVEAEVAGYDEKDISVAVEKHVLTIASTKDMKKANGEEKKEERKYLVREISRPSFTRSFTLPEDVDEENIKAETKDGILKITLPKTVQAQRGRIEVKIN